MSLVEEKVKSLIEPVINEFGFRPVRVQFSEVFRRNDLQVMAEPLKNREMTVNDCQLLSGHISAILDVEDPVSEPYRLEISPPGVDGRWSPSKIIIDLV